MGSIGDSFCLLDHWFRWVIFGDVSVLLFFSFFLSAVSVIVRCYFLSFQMVFVRRLCGCWAGGQPGSWLGLGWAGLGWAGLGWAGPCLGPGLACCPRVLGWLGRQTSRPAAE